MSSPFGSRRPHPASPDADLGAAVEAILRDDPDVARLSRRILRAQRRLRRLCSPEAWRAYLTVEQVTNERYEYASRLLLRYGMTIGKRSPREPKW